jgi:hypothetical protein
MIEDFSNEFTRDDIHVRDHLQFELKSEFFINAKVNKNVFKQEFYLFIPSQLQINAETFDKNDFYRDQTNLIRYKTPRISLKDLVNPLFSQSPLFRLHKFANSQKPLEVLPSALDELKLFGNMFKTALRERVYQAAHNLDETANLDLESNARELVDLCSETKDVCLDFRDLQQTITASFKNNQLKRHFKYIDEFISNTIDEYLTILLHELEHNPHCSEEVKNQLCQIILHEKSYRKEYHLGPKTAKERLFSNESILHRQGLLNRFVLEALLLKSYRKSFEEKHGNILGALSAGIAMFVYMIVFNWNASFFINTSFSFIMLVVIIYILRDGIKDSLKKVFFKKATSWLHDYATQIRSPKGFKIGRLTENFAFIDANHLPPGFLEIRNYHFNEELQALQRHETIIQYKREIALIKNLPEEGRRRELTMIFRLNIERFIRDASDPLQPNLRLDSYTHEISEFLLPKVYHLNLIMRNSFLDTDGSQKSEIKKYRVVVDKVGIKRVEQVK